MTVLSSIYDISLACIAVCRGMPLLGKQLSMAFPVHLDEDLDDARRNIFNAYPPFN